MITKKKITGKKISLKCLNKKNISPDYFKWLINKKVNKFLEIRFEKQNYIKKNLISRINFYNKSKNIIIFGIFYYNQHIGNIKIENNNNHKRSEIGILIGNKKFWGMGVGSEAINLASEFAFKYFKSEILYAGSYNSNISSINSFKKAGWQINSIIKNYWKFNNKREDWVLMYKTKQ